MIRLYEKFVQGARKLDDLSLLFLRLVLAYGFLEPALMKLKGLSGIAEWFASMDYPVPFASALLATVTESLGVVLLTLGLGTRIIVVPLMFVMLVAALTVHWSNGFAAGENGLEIPLYYFLMLFALLTLGPGRYSVDRFISAKC